MISPKKYLLPVSILVFIILAALVRLEGFSSPLLDAYYFRQAHTATVARNFYKDGINLLRPRLDWFGIGKEQYLIQDFPAYQAIVAGLSYIFGFSTELARLVSMISGLTAGLCLYFLVLLISKNRLKSFLALIFFWFFPLTIFIHHTVMFESFVLLLHLLSVILWLLYMRSEKKWLLFIFAPITLLAIIGKITYGPFLLLFIVLLMLIYQRKKYFLKPEIIFSFFVIIFGTIWWQNSADNMNIASGNGFFSSKNPVNLLWNIGYISERFVLPIWQIRFQEMLGSITKISFLMGIIGIFSLLFYKNKEKYIWLGWLFIMLSYYIVFFRMQNHIYYFHIVTPIVAVLAAGGLESIYKIIRSFNKRAAFVFIVLFISFFMYKGYKNSRGYFVIHRDVERRLQIMNQYLTKPGPMLLVFPIWDWHSIYTYYTGKKASIISFSELGNLGHYRNKGYDYIIFQDFDPSMINQDLLKRYNLKLIHEDKGILIAEY